MTSAQLMPAVVVSLLAWRVYVRVKRNIGRQQFQPKRMVTRMVVLGVITVLLAVSAGIFHPTSLLGLGAGLLFGSLLAQWAIHLTRFEATGTEKFYTPNAHIGLAVTLLFIGRIVYRLAVLYMLRPAPGYDFPTQQPALMQSPLTLGLFGITAGYYVAYLWGVRVRMQRLAAGSESSASASES